MNRALKIAVVGGGWAGLAAAVEACAAGADVTLLEAARQLGGRARSVQLAGRTLDNGQHLLLGAYRETLRLMRTVGADPQRVLKRQPLALDYPATGFRLRLPRLPAPLNLAAGLAMARGASLTEKIAAARFMRYLQASDYRLDHECTVAELLDRNGQHGCLRRHLWEPLCLAALNTAPQDASAQVLANVLADSLGGARADTDLLLPAADLDQLFAQPAARFIAAHGGTLRLSARVEGFAIDASAGTSPLLVAGERYDRLIVATAPQHATALLAAHAPTRDIAAQLGTYAFEPIGTLYAQYDPQLRLPRAMLGLGNRAGTGPGQWVFDRGQLGGEPGLMAFVLSAQGAWEHGARAELLAALHGELESALARRLPPPSWHALIREARATFACRPGVPRPSAASAIAGVWLAGDYCCARYPATLEGAVRSGVAAAHGALQPIG
jgi:squalene-associated FAD-dependent desaturase